MTRLERFLALGLRAAHWRNRLTLSILNLACGRADETGTLIRALGPTPGGRAYLGIDLRPDAIAEARARWLPRKEAGDLIEFFAGDASKPHLLRERPLADFLFIRHQNFYHDPAQWDDLYRNALQALADDGLLAITSYFTREHELALACLRQHGATVLVNLQHPEARLLPDAPGKKVDHWLAIVSKGAPSIFIL